MHLKSLRVFCDVVRRRSFSRAADENSISQSAASQMVHHLQEHLGAQLIDRSKLPFLLTREAAEFYQVCGGWNRRGLLGWLATSRPAAASSTCASWLAPSASASTRASPSAEGSTAFSTPRESRSKWRCSSITSKRSNGRLRWI